MSKPKAFLKYAITVGIDLLLAAAYFFGKIPFSQISLTGKADLSMVLCDAFFVPGMLTLLVGLLMWVSSEGGLDAMGYLGSCLVKILLPGRHGTLEPYGDYVMRKRESRKKGGMGFLCLIGLAFLVIAFAFWGLFYANY